MVDWGAFLTVAIVSIAATAAVVALFATGLRLQAADVATGITRVGSYACFVVAALGALFGLYLLIPAFHGG
jgi:hypothetical protein